MCPRSYPELKLLPTIGSITSTINQIIDSIQHNALDLAFSLMQDELARIVRVNDPTNSAVLPDLSGTNVQQIVNVWGTKDILYLTGIEGKRTTLCGITNVTNIEIVGAKHQDYIRQIDEKDPLTNQVWNSTVAQFVTQLIQKSDTETNLTQFLTSSQYVTHDSTRNVFIVNLPGWNLQ